MTDVVSADWLADRVDAVRVVDVREPWEYDGIGHVPGAVNVPFEEFRADEHAAHGEGRRATGDDASAGDAEGGMLPGAETFGSLLGRAGVGSDDEVVAYDDTHGVFAARFLVTAELYGHDPDRLHLLDGDYSAYARAHPVEREAPSVEPAEYRAAFDPDGGLVDLDAVAAARDDPDAVLVDTREPWEFEEGHIPGAVQLDWRDLVDEESRGLKPRAELESLLAAAGVTPDRRVVLYCNTARRISHTYVVLRHLGYGDLAFYEGSLTEWEAAGRPLET